MSRKQTPIRICRFCCPRFTAGNTLKEEVITFGGVLCKNEKPNCKMLRRNSVPWVMLSCTTILIVEIHNKKIVQ